MARPELSRAIEQLRWAMLRQDETGLSDGQLLEAYLTQRADAAFAALVCRHSPMVWGVCRRILGHHQDAEDAFQATFFVLVRKAASIWPRERLANWLHGVAHKTALKAQALAARRQHRERPLAALPEPAGWEPRPNELRPVLDRELSRLPDKYRAVLILCDLEDKTRKQAARQLGVPAGTVASRLATARLMLAKRLARLGVAVAGAAWTAPVSGSAVPATLVSSTIAAARLMGAGKAAAAGAASAGVATLTRGVLRAMLLTKLKILTAAVLALTLIGLGTSVSPCLTTAAPADGETSQTDDRKPDAAKESTPNPKLGSFLASRFKYKVPIEIGHTEFKEGGHIAILEVWGTRPTIEIGGQYLVHGKYRLPVKDGGKLYFYLTAAAGQPGWNAWNEGGIPDLDLQTTEVKKGEGEFTLFHNMAGPGFFHLYLSAAEKYSDMYANVYFGTGDNVLKEQ
jgi:RNA polymerase sigma factor (sigma-70 family)